MDYNAFQPGAKARIISTNTDGILKRVDGDTCIIELPTGEQITRPMSDVEIPLAPGERPPLGLDTSGFLDA